MINELCTLMDSLKTQRLPDLARQNLFFSRLFQPWKTLPIFQRLFQTWRSLYEPCVTQTRCPQTAVAKQLGTNWSCSGPNPQSGTVEWQCRDVCCLIWMSGVWYGCLVACHCPTFELCLMESKWVTVTIARHIITGRQSLAENAEMVASWLP